MTLESAKLCFRHSQNTTVHPKTKAVSNNTSTELFHRQCDNKGPTLTIVAANHGFIFGGYNAQSWVPNFTYSEAPSSFLFCLKRPRGIADPTGALTLQPPFVLPVKPVMGHLAIKNSDEQFSPGWGEANKQDLFIAYKNLDDSYCRVGNIYQVPSQFKHLSEFEQWSLLAGRPNNWEVKEVEVYAVN